MQRHATGGDELYPGYPLISLYQRLNPNLKKKVFRGIVDMTLTWIMGTIKDQIDHINHIVWKTKNQVSHISTISAAAVTH